MTWQDSLEDFGWGLRSFFSAGETVIGAQDPLPQTDIDIRELRDYS